MDKETVSKSSRKRIFVLGAGASYVDGIPTQKNLMRLMLSSDAADGIRVDPGVLGRQQESVRKFLRRVYGANSMDAAAVIPLEDALTAIDQGQRRMETLQGISYRRLDDYRRAFIFCLAACIDSAQWRNRDRRTCTDDFAQALSHGSLGDESVSNVVISLNWDTVFERAAVSAQSDRLWIVDYCSYTNHWNTDDQPSDRVTRDISHITKKPLGLPTLKVLKLHGSLNWLYCPTCDRLFTHPDKNIARFGAYPPRSGKRRNCVFCQKRKSAVEPLIVTPTLIKDLGQTHTRMIWHNAHIELSEADEIIFIGYSFPLADFEFRYLLSRSLGSAKKRPSIRVVLYRSENPSTEETFTCAQEQSRYRAFFGDQTSVSFSGLERYVRSEFLA